jgi:formylmethanofuran dehydrogenase subunit E
MIDLQALLDASASRHDHLCPRQVLGVRAGLAGLSALGFTFPVENKSLLVIVETDGCFTDGIEVATGTTVGHRTLRVEDYGKIAATFIKIASGKAVRISPCLDVRQRARIFAPDEVDLYNSQLRAYQFMPDLELFDIREVELSITLQKIISQAGIRTFCDYCGEEIINEREVRRNVLTLCRACAGPAYYFLSYTQREHTAPRLNTIADSPASPSPNDPLS